MLIGSTLLLNLSNSANDQATTGDLRFSIIDGAALMKILLFDPGAGRRRGHSFIYISRYAKLMAQQGHNVAVFVSPGFEEQYTKTWQEAPNFTIYELTTVDHGQLERAANIKYRALAPIVTGAKRFHAISNSLSKALKLATEEQVDIFHIIGYEPISTYLILKSEQIKKYKKNRFPKIFITIHAADYSFTRATRQGLVKGTYKQITSYIMKKLLGSVSGAFAHGEWIKEEIKKQLHLPERIANTLHTVTYGTDSDSLIINNLSRNEARERLAITQKEKVLLFFGMIRKDKRLDLLLDAMSKIEFDNVKLLIAGSLADVSESQLHAWIKKYNCATKVLLHLKYIPEEEIGLYYKSCEYLVLPYDASNGSHSGPLSLACTFRVPIICSNVGQIGFFVDQYKIGFQFAPNNLNEMIKVIQQALAVETNTAFQENLAIAAHETSWETQTNKLLNHYQKSIRESSNVSQN